MTSLAERAAQLSPNARAALARELVRAGTTFPTDICEPVAVVGIGCRFPGNVTGPESFWQLLADGVDTIEQVPPDRWDADAFYDPDPSASGRMTTKWGGFVSDVDAFDADFFGITPREAVAMDPQHRMLLEVAWEALEHAGIPPDSLSGTRTGVMMGLSSWDYTIVNIERRADIDAYLSTGTPHCAAVGRIAYLLGLRGPAVAVDTACSSSLVAIHLACQSLRLRETDVALAGGVQLTLSPFTAIALSKWSALSPTGRCNSFDANADGFVRGEGCGVVVLKRLADAVRDQDRVLAVVRGSATNSDGRSNGMTAPNALAQRDVITSALKLADVTPDSVNYVETHGTGTVLGDPIEFESLAATYGLGKGQGEPVRIGVGQDQHRPPGGGRRCGWIHQGGAGGATWAHSPQLALHPVEPGHRRVGDAAVRADRKRPVAGGCRSTQGCGVIVRPQRDQRARGGRAGTRHRSSRSRRHAVCFGAERLRQDGRAGGVGGGGAGRLDVGAGRGGTTGRRGTHVEPAPGPARQVRHRHRA